MRVAVLAHGKFPDRAKTAVGILRYADHDVVAVLDRDTAGSRVGDHLRDPGIQDAPIVGTMADVTDTVDALFIGIAPIGGGFDESWRPDVRTAIERGCDVIAGLHYFLNDDPEFVDLATDHDVDLWDVRKPPTDIGVSDGVAADVAADIVLTVGTDCSVGKMTATVELLDAATDYGIDAGFIPTGQTGIMIDGWGIAVDRVISDFTAGAVEDMILERGDDHDVLFVEGQGSIVHPAYSGVTCSILHGAMADGLILCHEAGRDTVHGYDQSLPSLPTYVDLYESLAAPVHDTQVIGGALNTADIDERTTAEATVADYADAIDAPATDPVRFDVDPLLEALP